MRAEAVLGIDVSTALCEVLAALRTEATCRQDVSPTGMVWRTVLQVLRTLPPPGRVQRSSLPVCAWLPAGSKDPLTSVLLQALPQLTWSRNSSYRDETFLQRYGYCELIGDGPWPSDTARVGTLLLAPHTEYRAHAHAAEEIYLVLHGTARWQVGDDAPLSVVPRDVVHHPSGVAHAMQTSELPLLALYCWRGAIDAPARLLGDGLP